MNAARHILCSAFDHLFHIIVISMTDSQKLLSFCEAYSHILSLADFGRCARSIVQVVVHSQVCTAGSESRRSLFKAHSRLRVRPPRYQAGQHPPPSQAARLDPHRLWLLCPDRCAAAAAGTAEANVCLTGSLMLVPKPEVETSTGFQTSGF